MKLGVLLGVTDGVGLLLGVFDSLMLGVLLGVLEGVLLLVGVTLGVLV